MQMFAVDAITSTSLLSSMTTSANERTMSPSISATTSGTFYRSHRRMISMLFVRMMLSHYNAYEIIGIRIETDSEELCRNSALLVGGFEYCISPCHTLA